MTRNPQPPDGPLPSGLTCEQVTEALVDYMSDAMGPDLVEQFDRHLQNCTDCKAFFATYKSTVRATRRLDFGHIPKDLQNRVQQFLLQSIQNPPRSTS